MNADRPSPLPPRFVERLGRLAPAEKLPGVLASFSRPKWPSFRVNTLKVSDADALAELRSEEIDPLPAAGLDHVYRVHPDNRDALVRSAAFTEGRLYVQNVSSLLASPALGVEPDMEVLDLAAAPGGKTLHLAALMNNTGLISAVEPTRSRFFRLKQNLETHGVTCAKTYMKDGRRVGQLCPGRFDRVLLDAPCSGDSLLRADGDSPLENWSEAKIKRCASKQSALLASAVDACRLGGVILYCTCSTAPEENEGVIASLLERRGDELAVEPVPLPFCAAQAAIPGLTEWEDRSFPPELQNAQRILPDSWFGTFFLCRLRKV